MNQNNIVMKINLLFLFAAFAMIKCSESSAFGMRSRSLNENVYTTSVVFPAGYSIGDYREFVQVAPISAGASGYYQVSLAYTRGNVAAAVTHLASISHGNPSVWREVGRVNSNRYVGHSENFTIDCNTAHTAPRFRIRATSTSGVLTQDLLVYITVSSINFNGGFTPLTSTGNDTSVNGFLPMTNEWDLYVGNPFVVDVASLAFKALSNGNVGIGTASPTEKLSVNGKIRAKEVKVEVSNWPDYVFQDGYQLDSLSNVERFIQKNRHLPEMPSAKMVEQDGVELGQLLKLQQKKIEELTLYLINQNKLLNKQQDQLNQQLKEMEKLKLKINE